MTMVDRLLAEFEELSPDGLNLLGEQLQRIGRIFVEESARQSGGVIPEREPEPEEPEPEKPKEEEEYSVGRFGKIVYDDALKAAQNLIEFTRGDLAAKLGLKPVATTKWLDRLRDAGQILYSNNDHIYKCLSGPTMRDWVVDRTEPFAVEEAARVTRLGVDDAVFELKALATRGIVKECEEGRWAYQPITDPGPRERPRRMPPEKERPSYTEARATGMPVRVSASRKATRAQRSTAGAGGIKGPKQRDARYNKMQETKEKKAEERRTKAPSKAQQDPGFKSRNGRRR